VRAEDAPNRKQNDGALESFGRADARPLGGRVALRLPGHDGHFEFESSTGQPWLKAGHDDLGRT